MKILVLDDNQNFAKELQEILKLSDYKVQVSNNYDLTSDTFSNNFDFFIVNLDIAYMDGYELLVLLRDFYKDIPIFVYSEATHISHIIKAYDLGCDDYIKKPFDPRELLVKINKKLNIHNKLIHLSKKCFYDRSQRVLFYNQKPIQLTRKETLLLHILILNLNEIVSTQQIELFIWGELVNDTYVRQLISRIRKKTPTHLIENIVGAGYKICSKLK